jgi:TRAP-type C4-dicarboxylate transport system permease small subunit
MKRGVAVLVYWLDRLAVLALLFMMLVTVCDVVLRKVSTRPITGVTELVELGLGAAFFFALPGVFARGANIAVDMIDQWLPAWSIALKRLAACVSTLTLAMFAWHMWTPLIDIIEFGDTSADLQIPKIWFMAPAWLGVALAVGVSLAVLLAGEIEADTDRGAI